MKYLTNGITSVDGFTALGMCIGIKKGKKDFAIIYSDSLCSAAAVYTKNNVKGAPLYVTQEHLKDGKAQVIVINSGIANAATGKLGIKNAELICKLVAEELGIKKSDVLIASTGVIGVQLPMDKIQKGIKGCKDQLKKANDAAFAILTTDTVKKEIAVDFCNFSVGAMAKGSGMVHPNMATMLCFITTDADLTSDELKDCLAQSVEETFNMISIDRDTSTSDMVILMSNNRKKVAKEEFQKALDFVCLDMAKKIAADGEGATKLIEVTIRNSKSKEDSKKAAKAVIASNLVKCAMFGNDPNWGRIMSALGNSNIDFDESKVDIFMQEVQVVKQGVETEYDWENLSALLKQNAVAVIVDLNLRNGNNATAYGCDMSYGYVEINSHYHT